MIIFNFLKSLVTSKDEPVAKGNYLVLETDYETYALSKSKHNFMEGMVADM